MSVIIKTNQLSKVFRIPVRQAGMWGIIRNLVKREYQQITAVNQISFTLEEGEIVGFIGQNGAGKTTTIKMLTGLLYPSSGSVEVLGYNPWKRQAEFQKQFALVMGQKNQLWWDLPPIDTFELHKTIYDIDQQTYKKQLTALIELLDVGNILNTQVRKLSLGQRMKCELIASLLHRPKVLFLDEPTIGLDVVMQKNLRDFIKAYNQEFKATIILTSHYMGDVKELCKRAIVIHQGNKVFDDQLNLIIKKYGRYKFISFVFSQPVNKRQLCKFGKVKELKEDGSAYTAKIAVLRQQASQVASAVLSELKVVDLNIEEPPIDAIIREFFADQKH